MKKLISIVTAAALLVISAGAWAQSQGVVVKQSAFSVAETLNRLEAVFKRRGFQVFARIDHAAAAESIERELPPAEVLIFGNPKIATPLMQSNVVAGLDLPMKALAYRDDAGKVFLVYNHPAYLSRRHGIKDRKKFVEAVSRILTNLTDQAVKNSQ